jgi:hypothetical protein
MSCTRRSCSERSHTVRSPEKHTTRWWWSRRRGRQRVRAPCPAVPPRAPPSTTQKPIRISDPIRLDAPCGPEREQFRPARLHRRAVGGASGAEHARTAARRGRVPAHACMRTAGAPTGGTAAVSWVHRTSTSLVRAALVAASTAATRRSRARSAPHRAV